MVDIRDLKTVFFELCHPATIGRIARGYRELDGGLNVSLGASVAGQGPTRSREHLGTGAFVFARRDAPWHDKGEPERTADVAKSVDAADFNWSARGETRGAEPLKVGES